MAAGVWYRNGSASLALGAPIDHDMDDLGTEQAARTICPITPRRGFLIISPPISRPAIMAGMYSRSAFAAISEVNSLTGDLKALPWRRL